MTGRVDWYAVAGLIARHLRRWIAEALLALLSIWTGAERTGTGTGLAGFYPSLPGDRPNPLAAAGAWRACRDHRRTLPARSVLDVALIPGWPRRIGARTVGTAVGLSNDPGQQAADAQNGLPLASATNGPGVGTTAIRAGRGGRRPGLGAARMTGRVGAGRRASWTNSGRAACR